MSGQQTRCIPICLLLLLQLLLNPPRHHHGNDEGNEGAMRSATTGRAMYEVHLCLPIYLFIIYLLNPATSTSTTAPPMGTIHQHQRSPQ